ncbi:MAG: hypothetical protein HPY79_01270 [Bacteroidales bacterium]|nr:hypothetical protein [Bacteroidales bacterium]
MKFKIFFFILFFSIASFITFSQETQDETFIIGNKIYKKGSNWFKIGQGMGYHFWLSQIEYNTTFAYSFKVKKVYFQIGYHVSSDVFLTKPTLQRLNDFYFTVGQRKETRYFNLAAFGGISYSYGGTLDHTEWKDGKLEKWYRGFSQPGIFGTIDLTFKPFYDIGTGISIYGSINKYYNIIGLQLHFYLSGAYKSTIE